MSCDEYRDALIELVYDELDEPRRRAVLEHLAACPDCRGEHARLRRGRAAMARHRADEPPAAAMRRRAAAVAAKAKGRLRPARWAAVGAAAAAAAAAVAVWLLWPGTPPAFADPVEIERVNVSLTILSEPEHAPGGRYGPLQHPAAQMAMPVQQLDVQANQVGAQGGWSRIPSTRAWGGLALVRDQRVIRNLNRGTTEVRFTGVPAAIRPDTVRLRGLDGPGDMVILEQNYQYDLASAEAVLKRHVDQTVSVTFKAGGSLTGTLLSYDGATLVIRPDRKTVVSDALKAIGPRNIAREQVKDIRFERLPEGLLTTPTLVWRLASDRAARRRQFEVAYMTAGLSWRADYVLKLRPAAGAPEADERDLPQIYDTADLVGYATVANHSGVTYKDARLKLMAGDVNLIRDEQDLRLHERRALNAADGGGGGGPQFREKAFFEYHLYTLVRPVTIRSAETKQIELVSGSGIRLRRGYLYDRTRNRRLVRVVSEFTNSEADGLGRPLPKGVIRLYAPDPTGAPTYVSQTKIDHTPTDEKVRLPWAFAFDLVCDARRTGYKRRGQWDHHETWEYSLRNHKDHDVTITVHIRVPAATYRFDCARPWRTPAVGLVEIDVPVKANTAGKLTFSYRWNSRSGGGLTAPSPAAAPPKRPAGAVRPATEAEIEAEEARKRQLEELERRKLMEMKRRAVEE